jgi:hypothetical protein
MKFASHAGHCWRALTTVFILLGATSSVFAQVAFWTNSAGDQNWSNPANWHAGFVPGSLNNPAVNQEAHVDPGPGVAHPIINSNVPSFGNLRIGVNANIGLPDRIDQTGGTLNILNELRIGEYNGTGGNAEYNLFGGTLNVGGGLRVGFSGNNTPYTATLNIDGPNAVLNAGFVAAPGLPTSVVTSRVNINSGKLNVDNLYLVNPDSSGPNGIVNIGHGGVLTLTGDQRGTVDYYKTNGLLQTANNLTLDYDYNLSNPGKTTVRALAPGESIIYFQDDPFGLKSMHIAAEFFGYDSGVYRPLTGEPSAGVSNMKAYDYSSHLIKDTASGQYRLYTQGRYRARIGGIGSFGGTVVDGDHVFLHTSPTGLGYTWTNVHPAAFNPEPKPAPLFLQGKFAGQPNQWFSGNYNDPEVVKVNGIYYLYTQVEIAPGTPLDTGEIAQTYWADRVQLHTSTDGINFTRFADRSVFINIPNPTAYDIGHHEVMYVPWDDTGRPFWLYARHFINGQFANHVRIRSNDPYTFDWNNAEYPIGMIGIGQQVGYIRDAGGAPLYTRITGLEHPDGRWVPSLQFSRDGLNWQLGMLGSGAPLLLPGSETEDPRFQLLFFFGMSTLDGTGEWEEVSPGVYRVVFSATAGNTSSIFDSEIGVGEMFITLEFWPPPILEGDFNGDGRVDVADYVLWRKNPNSHGGNPAGYVTWRTNFGNSGSAGASGNAAVPEPSSIGILLLGMLLMPLRRTPWVVHRASRR